MMSVRLMSSVCNSIITYYLKFDYEMIISKSITCEGFPLESLSTYLKPSNNFVF